MSFIRLEDRDFLVSADSVTSVFWTDGNPIQSEFYTSSTQEGSTQGSYALAVYNTGSSEYNAAVQFYIAFGHSKGSGSVLYSSNVDGKSPSSTIYGQFRNLVLEDENQSFVFGNVTSSYFYAIVCERARYKEKLMPGTFNLKLSGSAGTIDLTDNSKDVNTIPYINGTRAYQIVSGSKGTAIAANNGYSNSGSYGLFLPDLGVILLNGLALDQPYSGGGIGLNTNLTSNPSVNYTNYQTLYKAITGSNSFQLNTQETITSDYVFIRARNDEFNYSTNPSFISGSTGEVVFPLFIESPQTYVTTVGLYNDSNELLAVAKLSKPLAKDFTNEALIRVKLDF